MKSSIINLTRAGQLAGLVLALCLAGNHALAGNKPAPGQSSAFGKTLAQWQDTYFRWWIGQLSIPPDANGNAAVNGVVLMPLPNASGDGTPASLSVTLNNGQAFTVPLFFLLGTSYTDGTPPDPMVDSSFFNGLNLTAQIDGVTVMDSNNAANYYSQFSFAPAIPISFPPIDSVIWCQGLAMVHSPLSVGTHTLKLDLKSTQALPPGFGGGFPEYHNTWSITVLP